MDEPARVARKDVSWIEPRSSVGSSERDEADLFVLSSHFQRRLEAHRQLGQFILPLNHQFHTFTEPCISVLSRSRRTSTTLSSFLSRTSRPPSDELSKTTVSSQFFLSSLSQLQLTLSFFLFALQSRWIKASCVKPTTTGLSDATRPLPSLERRLEDSDFE